MLTIQNYKKIKDTEFSIGVAEWIVGDIREEPAFYKIAFFPKIDGIFSIYKVEWLYIWRNLSENGYEYQIDCIGLPLRKWAMHRDYLKDPKELIYCLSLKILCKLC
jgi:hypothetical protein